MWFGATVFGNSVKIFPFETGLINVTSQAQEVMNPNRNEQYVNKYKASGWGGGGMFKHYFLLASFSLLFFYDRFYSHWKVGGVIDYSQDWIPINLIRHVK